MLLKNNRHNPLSTARRRIPWRRRRSALRALLCGALWLLTGCGTPSSYHFVYTLPGSQWSQDTVLTGSFHPIDTTATLLVSLDVRLTGAYPLESLTLLRERPSRPDHPDTLRLCLAQEPPIRSGLYTDYRFAIDTLYLPSALCDTVWALRQATLPGRLLGVAQIGINITTLWEKTN